MTRRWRYMGDVNLHHGGMFFDLSEMHHGYATVVEVTDLDSACGFRGALMIEEKTVPTDQKDRWPGALATIGASLLPYDDIDDNGRTLRRGTLAWRMCLVYALCCYGYFDVDRSNIVQPKSDGLLRFDSWEAKRIRRDGLRVYVRREFLGLSR